jgi:iron complex outermembrane recepter protein
MRKRHRLALAGVALTLAAAPALAQTGQLTDTTTVYTMGEVVVLGERSAVSRTATTYELAGAALQRLDARSARDALEFVPGLYFSRNARNEFTFRMRGFEQRQVSVFLDGVPISLPFDGLVDISQLAGADLQRVQVSNGFSSMLYGANSLGGSVNLITRPPALARSASLRLETSDHGRTFGAGTFSGGVGRLRLGGAASLDRADAFRLSRSFASTANEAGGDRDNSGFEKRHLALKAHYTLTEGHQLGVNVSRTDNAFDVPPNAVSAAPRFWRFPEWRKELVSVNGRHLMGPLTVRTAAYQDRYVNVLRSFDDATYSTQTRRYAFDSHYDDYTRGVNLYPSLAVLPFGRTEAVLSYRQDVHRQSDGREPWERHDAATVTVGVEQDIEIGPSLGTMLGAGLSWLRPTGAEAPEALPQVNGQAAAQYRFTDALAAHAAVSRKSRFPTLKELYSSRLGTNLPNPELRPETSAHLEVGATFTAGPWSARSTLFRSDLRDLIAEVSVGGGQRQMQNIRTARLQGAELDLQRALRFATVALNYAYLEAANTSEGATAAFLEYRPAHRVNALVDVRPTERFSTGIELSHTARQHFDDPDARAWVRLNDMTLVNLRMDFTLRPGLRLYSRADNVLDEAYFSQYGVLMPGRELAAGLEVRF